jgi:thiopurine S-methyltransferase
MEEWEQFYQEGVPPWDHREASPPLRQVLEEWPREWWGEGAVLVPGCGRGHDVALLAEHGIKAVGLDLSPTALGQARGLYGEGEDRVWVEGDLFDSELAERVQVGAVWEHTCFCAIDPAQRSDYVAAMASLLSPGSRLIGVFYLTPDAETRPPLAATREEIEEVFGPFFERGREEVPHRSYPTRVGAEWLVEFLRNS